MPLNEGENMTRESLLALFDAGDLTGLVLAVNLAWVLKHYPSGKHCSLVLHVERGTPDVILPVRIPSISVPPSPQAA